MVLWPADLSGSRVQVRVISGSAARAGHQVLWAADGEPLMLLFDMPGGSPPEAVYFGAADAAPAPEWSPQAGLILETRRRVPGGVDSWEEARRLWEASGPALGRSLVSRIFHGVHLHGPTRDFLSGYRGWFNVEAGGEYEFATVSDDASFALIDGAVVASWPGWHSTDGGRFGEYGGRIALEPGVHRIEYYNVRDDSGFAAVAAWRRPGERAFEVMPESAFVPVATFDVARVERRPGDPVQAAFAWTLAGHTAVEDRFLVTAELRVFDEQPGWVYRWFFDDGVVAEGPRLRHVFLRSGAHRIRLAAQGGGGEPVSMEADLDVHPVWGQENEWPDDLAQEQRAEILGRDASRVLPSDLAAAIVFFALAEDLEAVDRLGPAALERRAEFGPGHAEAFYRLGFHFQRPHLRSYERAEVALRRAIELGPAESELEGKAALHLAGFLIHNREDVASARALLDGLDEDGLPPVERRLRRIYEGDALLAEGHPEQAQRRYESVGTVVAPTNVVYGVRRLARLELARECLKRGEFDDVERIVREVEWETPFERLGGETGLLMIQAQLGRGEYGFAAAHCRRLLNAPLTRRTRAEVMYHLVEACLQAGWSAMAEAAYRRLQDEFEYSEAAARAKDRWGGAWPGPGGGRAVGTGSGTEGRSGP